MNIKTITFDSDAWQLVPKVATIEMMQAIISNNRSLDLKDRLIQVGVEFPVAVQVYVTMLAAAPQPEPTQYNKDAFKDAQTWKGMDGACAWHLIERHADNWGEIGGMMEAWLSANKAPELSPWLPIESAPKDGTEILGLEWIDTPNFTQPITPCVYVCKYWDDRFVDDGYLTATPTLFMDIKLPQAPEVE